MENAKLEGRITRIRPHTAIIWISYGLLAPCPHSLPDLDGDKRPQIYICTARRVFSLSISDVDRQNSKRATLALKWSNAAGFKMLSKAFIVP